MKFMPLSEKTDFAHTSSANKSIRLTVIMAGMLMGCVSSPPVHRDQKTETVEKAHHLSLSESISRIQ